MRLGEEARFQVYYEGRAYGLDVHSEEEESRVTIRFWHEQLEDGFRTN